MNPEEFIINNMKWISIEDRLPKMDKPLYTHQNFKNLNHAIYGYDTDSSEKAIFVPLVTSIESNVDGDFNNITHWNYVFIDDMDEEDKKSLTEVTLMEIKK